MGIKAVGFLLALGCFLFPVKSYSQDCADDNVCFISVKGAQCADGTQTGFSVTYRKGAKNLLIFLDGGGACWSETTCKKKMARNLTAYGQYEGPYSDPDSELNMGWGDITNPASPFASGYNMVFVPYCTGDAFIGNKVQEYGTAASPYKIRHVGYKNLELILPEIQSRFSGMDKVVLYGISAGGIGATWNAFQVAKLFSTSEVSVVNDGGLLFRAPYVDAAKIKYVYDAWGANKNVPSTDLAKVSLEGLPAAVVAYNQKTFPDMRYAYMSTYNDLVMTGFAGLLKASKLTTVVRNAIIGLGDKEFYGSSTHNVFYMEGTEHVFFNDDPGFATSLGIALPKWINQMLSRDKAWKTLRPDKVKP